MTPIRSEMPSVELRVKWANDGLEFSDAALLPDEVVGATFECTPCGLRTSGSLDEMRVLYSEHEPHVRSLPQDA